MKVIELNESQLFELVEIFEQAKEAADEGKPGMIIAQIFTDGMRCAFVGQPRSIEIQAVFGNVGKIVKSANKDSLDDLEPTA